MTRTKLIWFAFGAGVTAIASVMAHAFFSPSPDRPTLAYLELTEPVQEKGQVTDEDMIADKTGELARNCGAKFFETTFLYNDHAPTTEIALIPENDKAIDCLLAETAKRSIRTDIIYRKASNAQTH